MQIFKNFFTQNHLSSAVDTSSLDPPTYSAGALFIRPAFISALNLEAILTPPPPPTPLNVIYECVTKVNLNDSDGKSSAPPPSRS